MKEKIILIGGGGHCRAVIDVIEQENRHTIAGVVVNDMPKGSQILGYDVLGCDDDLEHLHSKYKNALVTVGQIKSNTIRVKLFNRLKEIGFTLPSIISPLAYVSKHSSIGEGTVVMHQALVNANAKIGANCIINTKALIEHDVVIENGCHMSTAAVVNGGVYIKENTFFGSNATSKESITIAGFIKAGSVLK